MSASYLRSACLGFESIFLLEVLVPWDQVEIERIEAVPFKPMELKIIFKKIPVAERQI